MTESADKAWRHWALLLYALACFVAVFAVAPIPQDLAYHSFADQRAMAGIPNALNVLSNLPFLLVGLLGVRALTGRLYAANRLEWPLFFLGVALVSLGSAYYHLAPDNRSLVWDRLPMTIGFMALMVALTRDYIGGAFMRYALWPAVIVGIISVAYWHYTDDLRLYLWVQFMPLGLIVLLMSLYESKHTHNYLLGVALVFYMLAKVAELYDQSVLQGLGNTVSGHTIKHLLAAAGCYVLLLFLRKRELQIEASHPEN